MKSYCKGQQTHEQTTPKPTCTKSTRSHRPLLPRRPSHAPLSCPTVVTSEKKLAQPGWRWTAVFCVRSHARRLTGPHGSTIVATTSARRSAILSLHAGTARRRRCPTRMACGGGGSKAMRTCDQLVQSVSQSTVTSTASFVRFTAAEFLRPLPVGFSGEVAPSMRRTWKVLGVPSCEADGNRGESVQPPFKRLHTPLSPD